MQVLSPAHLSRQAFAVFVTGTPVFQPATAVTLVNSPAQTDVGSATKGAAGAGKMYFM